MRVSSFVPCSGTTGAPELHPVGEVIENPEKHLRIYHIDPAQIKLIEEFYGLRNGRKPEAEYFRPLVSPRKRKPARKSRR